jgi:hypothetical protein
MMDWTRNVLAAPPGKPFPLRIRRDGVEVAVTPQPMSRIAGEILAMTGIEVEEVSAEDDPDTLRRATRAFYGNRRAPVLPSVLRVRSVQAGSPAAAIELKTDDVLLATTLNDGFRNRDYRIDSTRSLVDLLRRAEGTGLRIVVLRGTEDLWGTLDVRKRTR